ncbi:MAG: CBS domain-containing protein [Rubrimonas sp.]|uniref:CBS domain-containing protein n=1 Tax=Rubrimonas sp. TaxID=2036015 RepID=UPI002FDE1C67
MTVAAILRQKGSNEVATVKAGATLEEAVRMLAAKRIGAVVVSADGARVDGVLSERDVMNALAAQGGGCLEQSVASAMSSPVETCTLEDRANDILRRMTDGRFRHLPVMLDGRLHALVSIGDVVKYRISEIEMERTALEDMVKGF